MLVIKKGFSIVKKRRYMFQNIFYSDLDVPRKEEEAFREFLLSEDILKPIYISILKRDEKILGLKCSTNISSIKEYLFVESKLAGVGIEYFIIKSKEENICNILEDFFKDMSMKNYYSDKWIKELFSLNIFKLYKTDCDGDVLFVYEKN